MIGLKMKIDRLPIYKANITLLNEDEKCEYKFESWPYKEGGEDFLLSTLRRLTTAKPKHRVIIKEVEITKLLGYDNLPEKETM